MANYSTCKGCALEGQPCNARESISQAIRGLHITSIKWRCKDRKDAFEKGEPVFVSILDYEDGEPYRTDCIATCIGMRGRKVHAYVSKAEQEESGIQFRANGFVTVSRDHVRKRGGEFEPVCQCGRPYRIDGHEEHCEHHPDFSKQFEGLY